MPSAPRERPILPSPRDDAPAPPSPTGPEIAAVFAGGCAGALARAGLLEAVPAGSGEWPWATLSANLAGAFLLGLVLASRRVARPGGLRRPLLATGFCGALTTFSAIQLELLVMLDAGRWPLAFAYAGVSIALGLLAVRVGARVTRSIEMEPA